MPLQKPACRFFRLSAAILLAAASPAVLAQDAIEGKVGLGTWATQAEFKDIRVTQGEKTLFDSNQTPGLDAWQVGSGDWKSNDGVIQQSGNGQPCIVVTGDDDWSDYTLSLKARKTGGDEGFLISFATSGPEDRSWWNLGGWGNTLHSIESPGVPCPRVPGSIDTGRWYDIKLVLQGNAIKAYLDGKLIHDVKRTPPQRNFGDALIPDLVADPSVVEFDGTFYLYGTTDGMGRGLATAGLPVVWKSRDFEHWIFEGSIFPKNFDAKYWAPSAPVKKDGRYYLFPTLDNRITATVSDSPEGPFTTLDGKDIYPGSGWQQFPIEVGHPIDAEIFRDDDGSYYMMWSQRFIAKMNPDFTGFDGEPVAIRTKRGGYSEGPWMFQREGIYYYLYTLGGSEGYQYAYMMSTESPLGPWVGPDRDIIARTDHEEGVFGPGHGCFFNPSGTDDWYFVHLEFGRRSTNRHVMVQKMHFNPDGTIQPIQLSQQGVGPLRSDPAYDSPNLALDATATASSTRGDEHVAPVNDPTLNRLESFDAAKAIDGSNGSRWMAVGDDAEAWLELDLGEPRDIRRTELYFVKPTTGHAYRLEYSLDGETWQPYGGHNDLRIQSPHVDRRAARARYLRVTIEQGTPGVWEFAVY